MFPRIDLNIHQSTLVEKLQFFCVGGLVPYLVYKIWSCVRSSYLLRRIPGPKSPSKLWGCDWDMHSALPGLRYLQWKDQYGDIVKFKGALGRNILAISDPRAVKFILEENVFDFPKPQGVREWFRSLVGDGLLVVEGKEAHARQRKLFAPALSPTAVKPLLPAFYLLASKMVDRLVDKFNDSTSNFIEEDLQWWANRFSLDAIGLAGFSYDFCSLSGDSNSLAVSLEALTNTANNFSSFVMKALFFSFPVILKIPSQKGRYIAQTRAELGKVALDMWNQAKNSDKIVNRTLMSMMMDAEGAEILSEEEIAAQLRTLVQAGYETVGCELAWIIYEIARCPDIQEVLREEIGAVSKPTYEDIVQKMPFLDAVIKESLRLHPPIPELTHVANHDSVVPISSPLPGTNDPTIMIPRGTIIHVPVNVFQTETDVWGNDATTFKPQRWLDNSVERSRNLIAFSTGPRTCPGRYFAMLEMKVMIMALLKSFRLELIPDKPVEPFWSFVVRTSVRKQGHSTLPLRLSRI